MTVRFFPGKKLEKSSLIAGFLDRNRVKHELVSPDDIEARRSYPRFGDIPAVEVDGRLFVDPNSDALRRILHLENPAD